MSLEEAIRENTEATNRLSELLTKFKPNAAPEQEEAAPAEKKTTTKKTTTTKKAADKKPSVTLKELQALAAKIIPAGGRDKAKAIIGEAVGKEGAKLAEIPQDKMPEVKEKFEALQAELEEEDI